MFLLMCHFSALFSLDNLLDLDLGEYIWEEYE